MAKKVEGYIKLQIPGQGYTCPPVGPALDSTALTSLNLQNSSTQEQQIRET